MRSLSLLLYTSLCWKCTSSAEIKAGYAPIGKSVQIVETEDGTVFHEETVGVVSMSLSKETIDSTFIYKETVGGVAENPLKLKTSMENYLPQTNDNLKTDISGAVDRMMSEETCNDKPFKVFTIYSTNKKRPCSFLNTLPLNKRRNYCRRKYSNAAKICPDTCLGKCLCTDNKLNQFKDKKGRSRTCQWIGWIKKFKERKKYCNSVKSAKHTCPLTCEGWCLPGSFPSFPVLTPYPTGEPSSQPTLISERPSFSVLTPYPTGEPSSQPTLISERPSSYSKIMSGIERDISDRTIFSRGWIPCYSGTYSNSFDSVSSSIIDQCQGTEIMYSCREVGESTWKLIGYGSREKAFTPTNSTTKGIVDGLIQWYFYQDTMGFASANDSLELDNFSCDSTEEENSNRLCWYKVFQDLLAYGGRCGDMQLYYDYAYLERSVWTKGSGAVSPAPTPFFPTKTTEPSTISKTKFDITLINMGDDHRYDHIFEKAKRRWEKIVIGDEPDQPQQHPNFDWFSGEFPSKTFNGPIDDLVIGYSVTYIDGISGILGAAGPTVMKKEGSSVRTVAGIMNFDKDDFQRFSENDLELIIIHEMGHVLGIGFWIVKCSILCIYTCERAHREYQKLNLGGSLRLQPDVCGHWAESNFGYEKSELMTPFFENDRYQPLSRVTVGALFDLGYKVDFNAADPWEYKVNFDSTDSWDNFSIQEVKSDTLMTPETTFVLNEKNILTPKMHFIED